MTGQDGPREADGRQGMEALDALVEGARVRRTEVMDDNQQELTNAEVGRIRKRVLTFLEAQESLPRPKRMTKGKLAGAIGESKSTVSQVSSCTYPKAKTDGYRKRDDVLRKLDRKVAELEAQGDAPKRAGFVWTRVARDIHAAADVAVKLTTIGCVWGDSGIGKSLTLEALLGEFPGAVLLTIDDSCHSKMTFLRALADRLKINAHHVRRTLFEAVAGSLRETKRLVIVDEAHLADLGLLTTVRQLYDRAESPFLLVGMPKLPRLLMQGRGDDGSGATLYRRIMPKVDLQERCRQGDPGEPLFTVQDVQRVFRRNALRIASDGMRWLGQLCCMPECGSLGACAKLVQLATLIGQQTGQDELTLQALLDASQLLLGVEGARQLANRISQRQTKVA